jgi:hypothetical protein
MNPRFVRSVRELAKVGGHRLNLVNEHEGDFTVWFDTEVTPCDGACIGTGETARAAIDDAAQEIAAVHATMEAIKQQYGTETPDEQIAALGTAVEI